MLMRKYMSGLIVAVLLLCSMRLMAYADFMPDLTRTGSITITMQYGDETVPGGELTLYQAGILREEEGSGRLVMTEEFSGCGEELNQFDVAQNQSDAAQLASLLAGYASSNQLAGVVKNVSNDGAVVFERLEPGLYLIMQEKAASGYSCINPFLVMVPMVENGEYIYEVTAEPKMELMEDPSAGDDPSGGSSSGGSSSGGRSSGGGGGSGNSTSESSSDQTELTEEDSGEGDGSDSSDPHLEREEGKGKLPQTGQWNWPVPVLAVLGLIIFSAGWVICFGKKKDHDES